MRDDTTASVPDLDYTRAHSIPLPRDVSNEVVPGLHQGGLLCGDDSHDFDRTLTLAEGYPPGCHEVRMAGWFDGPRVPTGLRLAVDRVVQWREDGDTVLVRCAAGLNRSGLVVASVLITEGWGVEDAIQQVRDQRSPWALCNPDFVDHLRAITAPKEAPHA